jgi:hypothetical protein
LLASQQIESFELDLCAIPTKIDWKQNFQSAVKLPFGLALVFDH